MARQTTLDTYSDGRESGADGWPPWDEYGPPMTRPIPESEQEPSWKQRMRDRGFCPNCLIEHLSHPSMHEYHLNDMDRPERIELWREQARQHDRS